VLSVLLVTCTGVLPVSLGAASNEIPENLIHFDARFEPATARPGEHVRTIITATLAPGWHIYSLQEQEGNEFAPPPTLLLPGGSPLLSEGLAYEVNPKIVKDTFFNMVLAFHEKAARFYLNYQVPKNQTAGVVETPVTVQYQACNDRICAPPRRTEVRAALTVEPGEVRPAFNYMERTVDFLDEDGSFYNSGETMEQAMSGGIWAFLLLAAAMGAISLLTPCVFPMIPITVSFFAHHSHEKKSHVVKLAVLFALGMILTYTGLGLALTFFVGASGASQFATSPWVNLVVAGFFVVFALSLMGLFDLVLPPSVVDRLDKKARNIKGSLGVMVMGLAFTATAFTCTVQFVGTLLIAALGGDVLWPVLGMLVFSTVFALPFFLLALFPKVLSSVQGKGGPWMTHLKVVLGIMELMAALKFVSNTDLAWKWGIFDREFLLAVWAVGSAIIALYVLHWFPWKSWKLPVLHAPRLVFVSAFTGVAVYFAVGFSGRELDSFTEAFLPPSMNPGGMEVDQTVSADEVDAHQVENLPWHPNLDLALAEARKNGKPVFVDFTGYTCVNCRWMEKKVFTQKPVYESLKTKFVLAKLYTDGGDYAEANQKVQVERFRTLALPYYVVLTSTNSVVSKYAGIMREPGDFLAWLEGGISGRRSQGR